MNGRDVPPLTFFFVVALVLGFLRMTGYQSEAFQAAAHLYVGGLFGAAIADPSFCRWFWLAFAGGMTVIEIVCFTAITLGYTL